MRFENYCIVFLFTICTVSQLFWNRVCTCVPLPSPTEPRALAHLFQPSQGWVNEPYSSIAWSDHTSQTNRAKYWVHKWTYFKELKLFCFANPFLLLLILGNILIFWDLRVISWTLCPCLFLFFYSLWNIYRTIYLFFIKKWCVCVCVKFSYIKKILSF